MGNVNRKVTKQEKAAATRAINQAYPEFVVEWGSHSSYGGHRAPRDHTIAFRLKDERGKYHSNVVWLMPHQLAGLTAEEVVKLVNWANGK